MKLVPGDAVRVKGELDEDQRFNFFVLESRHAEKPWDVFSEKIGVVSNVNEEKQVIRYIVDREVNGEIPMSELSGAFAEGDAIEVRLSRYVSKRGPMYRVLLARATDKKPSELLKKDFSEEVRVSNGMGFTHNDIFVPAHLLAKHHIDDQKIAGTAVLSYNVKRARWGWKAVAIDRG